MDWPGYALGVVGLVFGLYQLQQAKLADKRLKSMEDHIVSIHRVILPTAAKDDDHEPMRLAAVDFADIDGDGENELLVQHYQGAHGTNLRVFGWQGITFDELPGLSTYTPEGFTIKDVDGDGRIEVAGVEVDWERPDPHNPGGTLPYAGGARKELLYRFEDGEWKLLGEHKLELPDGDSERVTFAPRMWNSDPSLTPPDG